MRRIIFFLVVSLPLFSGGLSARQNPHSKLGQVLAGLPQPWKQKVHRITLQEYEATVEYWSERHPGILQVERVGESVEKMPIFLLKITDSSVPDEDKQVCLVTALHGGPERSGTTTILHLAEWLLGDSKEAADTRRKQVLLLMPVVNPYAFFVSDRFGTSQGMNPYGGGDRNWDLENLSFKQLEQVPEIRAVFSVMNRYRPEVHADVHGTGLQEYPQDKLGDRRGYRGQTMFESTGSAYSNFLLRPWDPRITDAMIQAGVEAGYGSDRAEADAQRGFWAPDLDPLAGRLWRGRTRFYTAQYGYARYHTLQTVLEVGWEEAGAARLKGLLRIGNGSWQGQPISGYPVNRVKSFTGHYVTAWGRTAAERRVGAASNSGRSRSDSCRASSIPRPRAATVIWWRWTKRRPGCWIRIRRSCFRTSGTNRESMPRPLKPSSGQARKSWSFWTEEIRPTRLDLPGSAMASVFGFGSRIAGLNWWTSV